MRIKPILVTGATGLIGENVCCKLTADKRPWVGWTHRRAPVVRGTTHVVDLADADAIAAAWEATRPEVLIHLGALSTVRECEENPALAQVVNVEATTTLARLAAADGVRMLFASTDLVFEGTYGAPFDEEAPVAPRSRYARTKVDAEARVLDAGPGHLVCRIGLTYGPHRGGMRQLDWIREQARGGEPVSLYTNERRSPIDVLSLADALVALTRLGHTGVLNLAGSQGVSRFELGQAMLARARMDVGLAHGVEAPADRPADVRLDTTRAQQWLDLPDLATGLGRVFV